MPIKLKHDAVDIGDVLHITIDGDVLGNPIDETVWTIHDANDNDAGSWVSRGKDEARWRAVGVEPGFYSVRAEATGGEQRENAEALIYVREGAGWRREPVRVALQRADLDVTPDASLWEVIKLSNRAISYDRYAEWMEYLFCRGERPKFPDEDSLRRYQERGTEPDPLPFPDIEGYRVLKAATEAFLELNCGVFFDEKVLGTIQLDESDRERLGLRPGETLRSLWDRYLGEDGHRMIPYLHRVRSKLADIATTTDRREGELCDKILEAKFTRPCLLELIWCYWHEEGMLVQTVNAISMRFQNRRRTTGVDPLANLAIDPLRPLSNLLWGYIQDEQHRLTVARRGYEYDQEYGMALLGEAVPPLQAAESRQGFLQAFHNLLHRTSIFYKEDDLTTVRANAFSVLNALREVHLLLAEGANNQYRDLPWTARGEMLMQQWLLARPEFREFLPTRAMVVYPEPWMDRVDAMKRLQGWTSTSVRVFHDLGRFGEQILLSIRFGDWSDVVNVEQAANWARFWRQEVQWYIHAYQSVTDVDLSADIADVRQAEQARARALPPAFHLQRQLAGQRQASGLPGRPSPMPLPAPPS